jgi:pimeloyl-ACP methyl ester carboxylesterase
MLPTEIQFQFYDGKYECEPAPEVLEFFPPPYLTWYNTPTVAKVADAHNQVRQIVEQDGPFDAVVGFSQGAAVAASILLHAELEGEAPMFKAAIFIGSPVPFARRTEVGIDARKYFGVSDGRPNEHGRPTMVPAHLVTDPAYLRNPAQLEDMSIDRVQYQMFHPTVDDIRIRVPTGHVFGRRDKWYLHSKDLVGLCHEDKRIIFEHDGGHEVPRAHTEELCDLIETVLSRIE